MAEPANFRTHLILRDLRPAGSTARAIRAVSVSSSESCLNYFFRMVAWCFQFRSRPTLSLVFTFVASVQMWLWAVKKHACYIKEFPDYPKNRKPMIPFLC